MILFIKRKSRRTKVNSGMKSIIGEYLYIDVLYNIEANPFVMILDIRIRLVTIAENMCYIIKT